GDALFFGLGGAGLVYGTNDTIVPLADTNSVALYRANASVAQLATDKKVLVAGGLDQNNVLFADAAVFNPAKITTDQDDYAPGTPATITGTGYAPNETVYWQVLHADGTPSTGEEHGITNVVADAEGKFSAVWPVCTDDCVGALLEVTAWGETSGLVAKAQFTDGNISSVGVSAQSPNPVIRGNSATYTVTVNFGGNS